MVLALGGGLALLAQRRTEPPITTAPSEGGALRVRGVVALVVVFGFMGVVFGGAELAVVAICEAAGRPGASGALLALWAMGSLVAGLAYGTVAWRRHPASRLVPAVAGFAVGAALLPLAAGTLPTLAVAFAVCGAAIAPTVIAGFATVERLVPPGSLTEGFTWLATALQVGFAASLTITGQVVDSVSPRAGLVVPAAAAASAAVVSLVVRYQAVPATT
jgi:predicted MFS family arabinose efflux permease